jgi:hypothetical protein
LIEGIFGMESFSHLLFLKAVNFFFFYFLISAIFMLFDVELSKDSLDVLTILSFMNTSLLEMVTSCFMEFKCTVRMILD